ncbi:unnamed protein product, partial [Phaeothamnion confervicola]
FRRRRLTFASQTKQSSNIVPDHAPSGIIFKSHEMGEEPDREPPFPTAVLGTYSCHGMEPSWDDSDAVCAKINQDRGCVVYPFLGKQDVALFCVFDGHGERGDAISNYAMNEMGPRLAAHPAVESDPPTALKEVFVAVDRDLETLPGGVDCVYSGTTAVVVLMLGTRLYVANAGDSRAAGVAAAAAGGVAAGGVSKAGALVCVPLTIDHDPDRPTEQARIKAAGGFISPPLEEGLSARVWLDAANTQVGLAMARSIGDHAVKGVGVIADPEVTIHDIAEGDKFLLMGSDGVWEFIPSQTAIDLVAAKLKPNADGSGGGATHACEELIAAAAIEWRGHEG